MNEIKISEKIALTVEEASAYSNIGLNTLRNMMKQPKYKSMILHIGTKQLIKREAFEQFIAQADYL